MDWWNPGVSPGSEWISDLHWGSKTTTEVLRGPRIVTALKSIPQEYLRAGQHSLTQTLTMKHPSTCYFSATPIAYSDPDTVILCRSTDMQLWTLESIFPGTQILIEYTLYTFKTIQSQIHQTKTDSVYFSLRSYKTLSPVLFLLLLD